MPWHLCVEPGSPAFSAGMVGFHPWEGTWPSSFEPWWALLMQAGPAAFAPLWVFKWGEFYNRSSRTLFTFFSAFFSRGHSRF